MRALALMVVALLSATPAQAQIVKKCPPDSIKVGNSCVDVYEASVWQLPDPIRAGKKVVKKIEKGTVKLADLIAAGAVQLGCTDPPFNQTAYPLIFPRDGNWTPLFGSRPPTPGVYAVSIAGVLPSSCTSQLQAQQACRLAGKRLIRNDEWQRAAAGTPDPDPDDNATECEIGKDGTAQDPVPTGSRSRCRSSWGTADMVGNVDEWVAEWGDRNAASNESWTTQTGIPGNDRSAFGGGGATAPNGQAADALPSAPFRGGNFVGSGGVFTVFARDDPTFSSSLVGFRCAR